VEIDFRDPTQLIALALVAIVIAAIALTFVFKPPTEVNPSVIPSGVPGVSPSSTQPPLPSILASQQKYDYGNFMLDSKRETQTAAAGGETSDEETLTNKGSGAARFGVAEVFPRAGINDVEITAPPENDPVRLGATRHIDANPLTQLTDFELAAGQNVSFSARSTKTDLAEKAPVRLLTDAELTAFQRLALAPVLAKIAELVLPLQQARALEAKVNTAFTRIKAQQNAFEDYVDAVEEFVDEIHDETVAAERAKPTPRPTPDVSKMQFPIPTPPAQPTQEEILALFPKLPEKIVLTVSENNPADVELAYLNSQNYLGQALYKINGEAAKYLQVSAERLETNYLITVSGDVEKTISENRIPFDEKKGEIEISFSLLPTETKKIPVTIIVKHTEKTIEEDAGNEGTEGTEPEIGDEPAFKEQLKNSVSEKCLEDAKRVADIAMSYEEKTVPECEWARKNGGMCACFASFVLKKAGIKGITESQVQRLYDLALRAGGILVSEPTLHPTGDGLIQGDLVFTKTYPGSNYKISHVDVFVGKSFVVGGGSKLPSYRNLLTYKMYNGEYQCNQKDCEGSTTNIPKYQGAIRVIPSCIQAMKSAS